MNYGVCVQLFAYELSSLKLQEETYEQNSYMVSNNCGFDIVFGW